MSLSFRIENQLVTTGTDPTCHIGSGSRTVSLFGEVEFIVNYRDLCLHRASQDDVRDALLAWCSADNLAAELHSLTELEGRYLILVEENGQAAYLYTGNDNAALVYYAHQGEKTLMSTSWIDVLKWVGRIELSEASLQEFMAHERTLSSQTLFKGVSVLRPYSLYQIGPGSLTLVKHAYPGMHTVQQDGFKQYDIEDYVRVIGAYEEHFNSFALAYSGGVDSRLLAYAYRHRLKQLLTIVYQPPFVSQTRYQSSQSSQKLAQAQGLTYTPVVVDWTNNSSLQPYVEHFAQVNPFSTYLSAHYYHLAAQVNNNVDVLLTGLNGDNLWDWGLTQIYLPTTRQRSTSGHSLGNELERVGKRARPRSFANYAARYYGMRWAMLHSFRKPRFRRLIERFWPVGPEFSELWNYPYKLFALYRLFQVGSIAMTTVWRRASDQYANKRAVLPYASPLAMHVSTQIPRQNFFDLKAPLRSIYEEYDATAQDTGPHYPDDQLRKPYSADLFNQPGVTEWTQQFLNDHCSKSIQLSRLPHNTERGNFYEHHLYYLFRYVEEQMAVAE